MVAGSGDFVCDIHTVNDDIGGGNSLCHKMKGDVIYTSS